ncbi:MAG: HAMP domain-containing sensor histidine kinase, partial [Chitinophagales bacterium]
PHVLFFWTVINLVEPLIFVFAFSYFLELAEGKKMSINGKWIILALLIPTIIMAPIGLSVVGFDYTTCDRNVIEGIAAYYNYALEALFLLLIVGKTIQLTIRNRKNRAWSKSKLFLAAIGTSLLLFSFLLANFLGTWTGDYETSQLGHIAVPLFAAFLAYITVKYESFKPRILFIDTLVVALFILLASLLFVENRDYQIYANIVSFIIMIPLGYSLMSGIRKEVKQREELEKITKALEEANTELKKADQLKSEFLSFASHDLKSPVSKMKQWASLIHDGTITEKEQIEETLFKIKTTGDRALRLVDEFLNIRKIEEGKMEFTFEEKDIVEFTKSLIDDFQPIAKQKGLALTFKSSAKEAFVKMDAVKIRQVIENLIDNALKYTEEGSIDVSIKDEQKSVLISVKDTGPGIDKNVIPSLFAQFKRAPGETKKIKGTGLGLYIAKQIVLEHKGEVWAESEGEGKGSTFLVRLAKV